jgi:hypothetical protein
MLEMQNLAVETLNLILIIPRVHLKVTKQWILRLAKTYAQNDRIN